MIRQLFSGWADAGSRHRVELEFTGGYHISGMHRCFWILFGVLMTFPVFLFLIRELGVSLHDKPNRICVRDSEIKNDKNEKLWKSTDYLGNDFQINAVSSETIAKTKRLLTDVIEGVISKDGIKVEQEVA